MLNLIAVVLVSRNELRSYSPTRFPYPVRFGYSKVSGQFTWHNNLIETCCSVRHTKSPDRPRRHDAGEEVKVWPKKSTRETATCHVHYVNVCNWSHTNIWYNKLLKRSGVLCWNLRSNRKKETFPDNESTFHISDKMNSNDRRTWGSENPCAFSEIVYRSIFFLPSA